MRVSLIAGFACVLAAVPCAAQDQPAERAAKPLSLVLPTNTKDCLATLEEIVQRAIEIDLLDDQVDETEAHLEKLEAACHDGNFAEALAEAKAIERILTMSR